MTVKYSRVLLALTWCVCACGATSIRTDYENHEIVNRFREYIRIDTSQPSVGNANYDEAVAFWKIQAESIGLAAKVFEYYPGKPIIVITWEGTNTTLPSIMLNSHMDVVSVDESQWSRPPFAAEMDSDGNIYGRGTQDMKSVGIQYLEAIRRLMAENVTLARTVHMTMVPDEEIGGAAGMRAFLKSDNFATLNVGFVLDEGMPYNNSTYLVFYADRTPWQIEITCTGPTAHGSIMLENNAADKFRKVVDYFMDFRDKQMKKIKSNPNKDPGLFSSINLNKIWGGIATNIVPGSMSALFDIRIAPGTNETSFNDTITNWIESAGDGDCTHRYHRFESIAPPTVLDDSNIYWVAFRDAAAAMGKDINPIVSTGTTDSTFLRNVGIPALGFSPMQNTSIKAHANDEMLNAKTFLDGIEDYHRIITALGNAGLQYNVRVCPATSDMTYLRSIGIPAIGFAPIHNTVLKIHGIDEYLNVEELINGVQIYTKILKELANLN